MEGWNPCTGALHFPVVGRYSSGTRWVWMRKKWTSLIIAILNISLLSPMGYWNFRVHRNHLGYMLKCRLLAITWRIPKSLYLNRGQEIWVLKMHRSEHRWSTNHILGHSAIWEDFLWLCLPQVLYCMGIVNTGLPRWLSDKEFICQCRRHQFDPWSGKIPWRRKWQPIPVILPGKSHGQKSLVGYSPWSHKGVRHDLVTKNNNIVSILPHQ